MDWSRGRRGDRQIADAGGVGGVGGFGFGQARRGGGQLLRDSCAARRGPAPASRRSQAASTRRRVRYSPNWRISFSLSTRKVSRGEVGAVDVGRVEDVAQLVAGCDQCGIGNATVFIGYFASQLAPTWRTSYR